MGIPEPAVSRKALLLSGGVFWFIGAMVLALRAMILARTDVSQDFGWIALGIVLGILKARLILNRTVEKNARRIMELSPHKDKICLFAFQSMQSYILVVVMVGLGLALRLAPIDSLWLVVAYFAIATALLLGSYRYIQIARVTK